MHATIRRAGPGDEDALATLNAFVQALHVAHEPAFFKPSVTAEIAAWFRARLEHPATRAWIAVGDHPGGEAVGYVLALWRTREANPFAWARRWVEIDQVGVHPRWRRGGLARRLVEHALADAARDGIGEAELTTWYFNDAAQAAFRRLGFTPQTVRMRRALDGAAG